jgi:hypothetical protein
MKTLGKNYYKQILKMNLLMEVLAASKNQNLIVNYKTKDTDYTICVF